ncbi:hypothetical protein PNEG_01913 [Pneumocystis murina B123]|uniref:Magnesium transporter NIPA2 n=1 Tax=Pneumocystis murina (strain B123) TaxID=1069680 RepID=M7NM33_PNEMU|nr:hypothetical protein PNEG_01913 [Pneumocystis murina B123]EMR09728.1 hypothetical protein PNEG_01913 [Pneumocystis murina B123]
MNKKLIGFLLALASGFFIGTSFVIKKKGLLDTTRSRGLVAGQGHAYLKNGIWWTGMIIMIIGELCNFIAYAFASAILVTPLGAMSIVVCSVGSSIFLKERLSFVGKVGCGFCIIGVCMIVINAPEQDSLEKIQEVAKEMISVVFLSYTAIVFFICFIIGVWIGPRWGNKSVFVYISISSLVGGITVVCTQGFGMSIVSAISGVPDQLTHWFLYFLGISIIIMILVEINYLNKALNIFNTAIVTPIYFTYFTTCTIVSTAVLHRGFHGPPISIVDVFLGFLTIVGGIILLQFSIGADNTSDTDMLSTDLSNIQKAVDAVTDADILDPGPAAIRGTFSFRQMDRKFSETSSNNFMRRISYSSVEFQKFTLQSSFLSEKNHINSKNNTEKIPTFSQSLTTKTHDFDTHNNTTFSSQLSIQKQPLQKNEYYSEKPNKDKDKDKDNICNLSKFISHSADDFLYFIYKYLLFARVTVHHDTFPTNMHTDFHNKKLVYQQSTTSNTDNDISHLHVP